MKLVDRIFETLTGIVKVSHGEGMRRVHRGNQPDTVARLHRPRTSASQRLALKLMRLKPVSKHRKGWHAPGGQAGHLIIRKRGKPPYWVYVTDRPHGRTYPAAREAAAWVSTSKRGREERHREVDKRASLYIGHAPAGPT